MIQFVARAKCFCLVSLVDRSGTLPCEAVRVSDCCRMPGISSTEKLQRKLLNELLQRRDAERGVQKLPRAKAPTPTSSGRLSSRWDKLNKATRLVHHMIKL